MVADVRNSFPLRSAVKNLIVLTLIALPIWITLWLMQAVVFPPSWSGGSPFTSLFDFFMAIFFYYIALFLPVLGAGILQQILLWRIPLQGGKTGRRRILITATTLAIPATCMLFVTSLEPHFLLSFVVPSMISLGLYSVLVRPL